MNGAELFERGLRERPEEPAFLYFDTAIGFREAAERHTRWRRRCATSSGCAPATGWR